VLNDPNGLAFLGIAGLLVFGLLYAMYSALNSGWWRCPVCDFRTRSEEEALGHAAKHAQHKPIRES
jgi:hypothetical protein